MCLRSKGLGKWLDSAKTPDFSIVQKYLGQEDLRPTSAQRQVFTGFSAIHYAVLGNEEKNVDLLIQSGQTFVGTGQR